MTYPPNYGQPQRGYRPPPAHYVPPQGMPRAYAPYGYGPPPPRRVPIFGAALLAIGGLLAAISGVLPWIGDYTMTVTGFNLANTIESFGGDAGFTRFGVWFATFAGLVLIGLACIGLAKRISPAWATITASIIAALLAVGNIYDFANWVSSGTIEYAQIGFWLYFLSGIIATIGALGWASEKF